jgi:hypothetical protein
VRRLLAAILTVAWASAAVAQGRQPVEYRGLSARTALNTGNAQQTSVIVLRFHNPNANPVEVRDTRCEFRSGDKLVKQFSIARISVQPGESAFETPQRVEVPFNRAVCKPGKLS